MPDQRIRSDVENEAASRIDEWLRLPDAAKLRVRGINNSRLAVTEIRYDHPNYGSSDPVIHQDAFVAGLQLKPQAFHELTYDGKSIPVYGGKPLDTLFADLRAVDRVVTDVPFHSLQFFFSRAFIDELADDLEAPRVGDIPITPGAPVRDAMIARIGTKLRPALAMPQEVNELFASHCMRALGIYVCATYCGMRTPKRLTGGLSVWQERVAFEMIEAHLDGGIALEELASVCGLSVSRFAHAFKTTIGVAPYQWLLRRRIERTKALLKHSAESLADIAQSCGFADQSHFNRVFKRAVGASPGEWRQSLH